MDAIRAKAIIAADGRGTSNVEPGTAASECEVMLVPVPHEDQTAAAAAGVRAWAGLWADWDEFDTILRDLEQHRARSGHRQ